MNKKNPLLNSGKEKYLTAFLLGFFCLFISVLPVIIADGGYFIYYGDYNSQQIPFYNLANDAVRSGSLGWNWFTDLGSDFMGSYSFYLLGSPFFWLSVILPRSLVIYSMPFLLALKHGVAAMTAYGFIRRFVRSKNAALIGSLLYAFSGFQIYNIFFNHFQDVTAFFPLVLIALEERVNNNRRGIFAAAVAFMAILNYFFFTGQVVFLIIYFLMRLRCPDFKISLKKFIGLALEAIFGTMIAAFMLLPSALAILGNYRVSERLYGQDLVIYSDKTRIFRIIQTFFMPQDIPARTNLFSSNNAKWSSIGGYLPLFSMTAVLAFMKKKKKHWATRLVLICIVCAFIPILNSSFYMFNSSYYARWFYMPILIMAMMTAYVIDNEDIDIIGGIKTCGGLLIAFLIISLLPKKVDDEVVYFSFANDPFYFYLTLGIAVVSLIAAFIIRTRKKTGKSFMLLTIVLTVSASFICTITNIVYAANSPSDAKTFVDASINGKDDIYEAVSEDNFFRVDMSENYDNFPMSWGLPSMRAFQSVVSSSIMEFYPQVDVQRDVGSRADTTHYTLRGLFSVKYYYDRIDYSENEEKHAIEKELPGFKYLTSTKYFDIYENTLYIPMGFAYNEYISEEDMELKGATMRERILLTALVLDDKQIEKYSDIMNELEINDSTGLNKENYKNFCAEKLAVSSSLFKYDSYGFTSEISLDSPELVFFSVPYSDGWSAQVNGKNVDVEKVSYGFMAVKADAGDNTIEFKYRTPGLYEGAIISLIGLTGLIIYLFITRKNKNSTSGHSHYYDYTSVEKIPTARNYENKLKSNIWEE